MKSRVVLCGIICFFVLVATAAGVFYQSHGSRVDYVTVRGEEAVFQGYGLYQYDPQSLAQEGIIWDTINLFIGLPLLAIGVFLAGRRSLRGWFLLSGMLCYFFYVYLMYATMMAFNPLFPVYVAIFALSLVAFIINLNSIDVSRIQSQISPKFPRRLFAGYAFTLAAAMIMLWSKLILSIMVPNRFPADLAGRTTLQSQALDLGLIVPLAIATGILLLRRSKWGYVFAGISVTHGTMMFISIPAWIVVPLIQEGKINPIEAVPFLVLCLAGLVLAGIFYRSVDKEKLA